MERDECILVSEDDVAIGSGSKHMCHAMRPEYGGDAFRLPLHRAFSVLLFDPTQGHRMLLQRRSHHKLTFPGLWSNACCSHPLLGDASIAASIRRRLHDELGIPSAQASLAPRRRLAMWQGAWLCSTAPQLTRCAA